MHAHPILDRADSAREHINDAAKCLFRSMEADGSMMRRHWCLKASDALLLAAILADDEAEYWTLAAHSRQASTLAGQYYGDGVGTMRLFDELRSLAERGEQ